MRPLVFLLALAAVMLLGLKARSASLKASEDLPAEYTDEYVEFTPAVEVVEISLDSLGE